MWLVNLCSETIWHYVKPVCQVEVLIILKSTESHVIRRWHANLYIRPLVSKYKVIAHQWNSVARLVNSLYQQLYRERLLAILSG